MKCLKNRSNKRLKQKLKFETRTMIKNTTTKFKMAE